MKIIWDERKRISNLAKHGFDFEQIDHFDWVTAVFGAAHMSRYGQHRLKATGVLSGTIVIVIFALLGREAISLISLRPASARERKEFLWSRSIRH
ncbi:BrnT family toxin [Gellertiella hungarica]|uniref:BrnT family toxin n=1 Tax=Gellertiella hungarica TaxID=1572859 RepID=A0A7W6J858_9HYPH|nr:BrnT family toxin [Gellertiella hungarica]MBB4065673.1 hypothetical protein [Gellertiella hungarica]